MKNRILFTVLFAGLLFLSSSVFAQKAIKPRPSPMAIAATMLNQTYASFVYSQPHKKDREIFGKLVPYGKVWRFGANEATQFTTTGDLTIGDKTVKAGTYVVFCLPEKDHWTLIFNSGLGQWGAFSYDASKDVVKVKVPTQETAETWEPFTISFDKAEGNKTTLKAMWENTMIAVPVSVK